MKGYSVCAICYTVFNICYTIYAVCYITYRIGFRITLFCTFVAEIKTICKLNYSLIRALRSNNG